MLAGAVAERPLRDPYLSEDPIGFWGGANFYAYAYGAPTTLIDPYGLTADQPGFPPVFPKTPPMRGTRPTCCNQREVEKAIQSTFQQIQRMYQGEMPSGTQVGSSNATAYLPQPGGWMKPIMDDPKFFNPRINDKDACVRYCVRLHEWVHFTDPRPWNVRWAYEAMTIYYEYPAYVTELDCLQSFLK